MKFSMGDSVKVENGIMCPDDDCVCIAGWQGRIFDIEEVVGIRWDSVTLKQLPQEISELYSGKGLLRLVC